MTSAVLVPVKSFASAKDRLASALSRSERSELAKSMASQVLVAAKPLASFVVCDDPTVAAWAVGQRAGVIWRPAGGLNEAVSKATRRLAERGFDRVIIAHGDLPLAKDLAWVDKGSGILIVTDERSDGTNVMALPLGTGFRFFYGSGSALAHYQEAERRGLNCQIVHDRELGHDIDTPADLQRLGKQK